jgi:hypothetical protein
MVIGDVNGDGYSNDRAFIFDPANTADAALASEMDRLLANSSGAAKKCLRSQLGKLAERNSCEGPWTSSASLNFALDPIKFRMPNRAQIQFSLANPLGAADLVMHGSNNLKGWGQSNTPDQALLYVKGFDQSTQRFKYEVNQRFGATRPAFVALRSPVILTMAMRFDLGPTRERQTLMTQLSNGRSVPGTKYPESLFRSSGAAAIPNTMSTILRQQDTLRLTAAQADSIATMNRLYTIAADSIWAPVAKAFGELPEKFNEEAAYDEYLRARRATVDLMMYYAPRVNALLTPSQRRKLPAGLSNSLDTRYLLAIRSGNGLYLGGAGTSIAPPGSAIGAELALREAVMIVR